MSPLDLLAIPIKVSKTGLGTLYLVGAQYGREVECTHPYGEGAVFSVIADTAFSVLIDKRMVRTWVENPAATCDSFDISGELKERVVCAYELRDGEPAPENLWAYY